MIIRNKYIMKLIREARKGKSQAMWDKEEKLFIMDIYKNDKGEIPIDYEVYAIVTTKYMFCKRSATTYLTMVNEHKPDSAYIMPINIPNSIIIDDTIPNDWILREFDKPMIIESWDGIASVKIVKIIGHKYIVENLYMFDDISDHKYALEILNNVKSKGQN